MKKCRTCEEEKPATEFYKLTKSKDGLNGQCKGCYNARIRKWRKDNPEKRAAFKKKWRAENPDKVNAMQRRADKNNADRLTDGYVRNKIVQGIEGLDHSDVPDIMVELKRNEIKIERLIKFKKNESNK
jgi:hypothetical protein